VDKTEAKEILGGELAKLRQQSYEDLRTHFLMLLGR
jgi:hypothetical protein